MTTPFIEDNDQTRARREHLDRLRAMVGNVYPNKFERTSATGREDTITAITEKFRSLEPKAAENDRPAAEEIDRANSELNKLEVRISGRIATPPRVMGKAAFVHLSDGRERLQIYVRKADVRGIRNDDGSPIEEGWELFNLLDHGDFIGISGFLFVTKTGELSVHVRDLQFLAKALLPMPDKMHGIADPEIRQRQRYADLIAGSLRVDVEKDAGEDNATASRELSSREVFERRAQVIREMRRFLDDHGYIEVETPMLTPLATGAAARPFKTHHNALDIDLYARIAPELYLKRLVVGGFEKVYELNRNFRNEGISTRHNPEFTMLEFYCAYMDVNGMMDFCEEMLRTTAQEASETTHFSYGEYEIDFSRPFKRTSMKQAISENWPDLLKEVKVKGEQFDPSFLNEKAKTKALESIAAGYVFFSRVQGRDALLEIPKDGNSNPKLIVPDEDFKLEAGKEYRGGNYIAPLPIDLMLRNLELNGDAAYDEYQSKTFDTEDDASADHARSVVAIFEAIAEKELSQPTFITDFPKPISPLSKASPANPAIAERFELFIAGMECANGFSELNDPVEQRERFEEQMKQRERGDEEAMVLDEDYIRALSYGMPPAAGIGIGIDRLVMLLTNKRSIRDVILFPHMRPERRQETEAEEQQ